MNFSLPNIILGLLGISGGVALIIYAFYINHHILFAGWIENKYGPGTGTTFYRLLGVAFCIFFIFVTLGYIDLFGDALGNNSTSQTQTPATQTINAPLPNQNRIGQ